MAVMMLAGLHRHEVRLVVYLHLFSLTPIARFQRMLVLTFPTALPVPIMTHTTAVLSSNELFSCCALQTKFIALFYVLIA